MNIAMLQAWGSYQAARVAWPGLIGAVLLLGAAAVQLAGVVPLQQGNEALRQEIEALREQAVVPVDAVPTATRRALASLPSGDELLPLVNSVHALARRCQVALDQGEYTWQADAGGRTGRYRMSFPARGSYPQLRGWAADVLAEWPALALDEFNLRRDTIGSESVEAQVRFSVRVGGDRQ